MTFQEDGTVTASCQLTWDEYHADEEVFGALRGIVLAVHPSDSPDNFSASSIESRRGFRHEATVLITDDGLSEPNLILENVVIPPRDPCGIDDFSERLPRAVSRSLTSTDLCEQLAQIDYSELDGDRCLVQFIGGNIDKPYISNWWHHEANTHDPATSEQGKDGNTLKQSDPSKNKFRAIDKTNGVLSLITKEGNVYFDTTEANSKTEISPKVKRIQSDKGGNVQVNVKTSKQLELNWNAFVEGLAAGSNSQEHTREPDLLHISHDNAVGDPAARETDRTIVRLKSQEGTVSTGKVTIYCHKKSNGDGFFTTIAEEAVVIGQGDTSTPLATISISNGSILMSTPNGDNMTLQDNSISVTTSGGASMVLQGNAATLSTPGGASLGSSTGTHSLLIAPVFNILFAELLGSLSSLVSDWYAAAKLGNPWSPTEGLVGPTSSIVLALTKLFAAITSGSWDTKLVKGI